MKYVDKKVKDIKIAYVGGGSRGWAWGLMSDLVSCDDISGDVYLYDIDYEAAQANEIIGNKYNSVEGAKSVWNYHAVKTAKEAMVGADFVIISILPGTFDEMGSDVHAPEKYGIYQSVGDTTGPGGIIRAMRTIPMFEQIAGYIKEYCPNAWVINYTNPMTLCVKTLYRVFPEIKAFGCCHEVFGTQRLLKSVVKEYFGVDAKRSEIKVNPVSVNHFTWLTEAKFRDVDLFPYYKKFCEKYAESGYVTEEHQQKKAASVTTPWFFTSEKVKMELFLRFGVIAAAGDRHLAEFCPGKWYLESPEQVEAMGFALTPISYRYRNLANRLAKSERLKSGEEKLEISVTGEEGTHQMRALLGLCDLVTNVNIPNRGQIPNLPLGAVVETNAVFRSGSLTPVFAGPVPASIHPLVSRVSAQQENISAAIAERDLEKIFACFVNDPLVTCSISDARKLFIEMCENTKKYLDSYDLDSLKG
ncbi:MAG: alpha-glucosidase/alpha-galactosidase [Clostridia bacterium]|nr:alpha-glucosidase/alpha-galactosidase [Clostridia bacterium]